MFANGAVTAAFQFAFNQASKELAAKSSKQLITGKAKFSSVGEGPASYMKLEMKLRAFSMDMSQWTDFELTAEGIATGADFVGPLPISHTSWDVVLEGPYIGISEGAISNYFNGALVTMDAWTFSPGIGLSFGHLSVGDFNHIYSVDAVYGYDIGWTGFRANSRTREKFKPGFRVP